MANKSTHKESYRIQELYYYKIKDGFYEVFGTTDEEKICIEGNVCSGILKELIAKANSHGATVKRVKSKVANKSENEKIESLESWLRHYKKMSNEIIKLIEKYHDEYAC